MLVSACRQGPEAMMADYTARVARITGQPIVLPQAAPLPYPRARDRHLPLPEVRARLLDLTDFQRCNLTQLIAERNSIMGRGYWPATRRLDYEFRFGHRLARCHAWLADQDALDALDADDAALLEHIAPLRAVKAATRPLAWWAATWASDEFARYFSAAAALPDAAAQAPVRAFATLAAPARQFDDPPDGVALDDIESALQTLRSAPYGGGWVRAAGQMTATLEAAAEALEAVNLQRLCPQALPNPKARIFETVFYQVYAGRLQPYLAALHREGAAQHNAVAPLLAAAPAEAPAAFERYARRALSTAPGSLWADLADARQRHTLAWQRLLRGCGLMPDGSRPG